jgi:hypothetical protein
VLLIAASGLSLALIQRNWTLYGERLLQYYRQNPTVWGVARLLGPAAASFIGPVVLALTLAALGARFAGPRPSLRRIGSQPGAVACLAGALMVVLGEIEYYIKVQVHGVENAWVAGFRNETAKVLMDGLTFSTWRIGYAVAAVWLTLLVGRRWHPERSWIDRLGTACGIYWLAMILVHVFLPV